MLNAIRSGKFAVIALMATALLGLPEAALAKDRCDKNRNNNGRYSQNSRNYNNGYRNYPNQNQRYGTYRDNNAYRNGSYGYYGDDYRYNEPRSAGKSAAIIGGSAAAGAAVGAITGGTKGAIIGGAIGGAGGLIYDRTTRNNNRNRW